MRWSVYDNVALQEGREPQEPEQEQKDDLKLDLEDDEEESIAKRDATRKAEAAAEGETLKHLESIRKKLKVWPMACPDVGNV
jgi:hypothetical protein